MSSRAWIVALAAAIALVGTAGEVLTLDDGNFTSAVASGAW